MPKNYLVQTYNGVWNLTAVVATPKQAMAKVQTLKKNGKRSRVIDRRTQAVVVEVN